MLTLGWAHCSAGGHFWGIVQSWRRFAILVIWWLIGQRIMLNAHYNSQNPKCQITSFVQLVQNPKTLYLLPYVLFQKPEQASLPKHIQNWFKPWVVLFFGFKYFLSFLFASCSHAVCGLFRWLLPLVESIMPVTSWGICRYTGMYHYINHCIRSGQKLSVHCQ